MRKSIFLATTTVLFGCSLACAQVRSTSQRNAPAMSSAIPTAGAGPRSALGAIQLNLGALGPIPGSAIGTIMICPMSGIAAATPSTNLDASNAVGATGTLYPQLPPGVTPSAISTFGTSIMTAACNPTTATFDATEASRNGVASPIPGLATITGPAFSDATISPAAMEAGGPGLSPEIVVPTPDSSPAP